MKPAIKAVALDKDGVTFDTESLIYRAFRELIVREKLQLGLPLALAPRPTGGLSQGARRGAGAGNGAG